MKPHAPLTQSLVPLDTAAALIQQGRPACIAGDEALLRRLPRGRWIGGTIPYFMAERGGQCSREQVFVSELPWHGDGPRLQRYDASRLSQVCVEGPEHGYTTLVLPAFSAVHEAFAQEAPGYPDMYMRPLVGWISGVHLDDIGRVSPKVFFGPTGEVLENEGVAMHVPVAPELLVHVDIVNLFTQDEGAAIEFAEGGFSAGDCRIGGQAANLHDWMVKTGYDTRLPLVADYCGAMINVSVKKLDAAARRVEFYAPVFAGTAYHAARPVGDYVEALQKALQQQHIGGDVMFSCNCILNYAYGGLEGRRAGPMHGPATFGEIGYQLLNQTLVVLRIQ